MPRFPLASTLLALSLAPLGAHADSLAVPNTFLNETPADAKEVNANFDAVEAVVNDIDARVGSVESDAATSAATLSTWAAPRARSGSCRPVPTARASIS